MAKKTTGAKEVKKDEKKKGAKAPATIEVTQELFDLNTFLADEGAKVGDVVELTADLKEKLVMPEKKVGEVPTKSTGKIKCPASILKGSQESGFEYIRTYPEGQEAEAQMFLGKNPNYSAVSPDDIEEVVVSFQENETKKDESTNRMVDTGKRLTRAFKFTLKKDGADWLKMARAKANEGVKRSCIAKLFD